MLDLKFTDVRPFIVRRDLGVSKAFYEALGWKTEYLDDQLALMANGAHRLYLQRYNQRIGWGERSEAQHCRSCFRCSTV